MARISLPAAAGCYEGLGCTDVNRFSQANLRQQSCDTLYFVRNSIYQEHGYCFKTARARAVLGNAGCYIHDAGAVPLNRNESANVAAIKQAENWLGCR